MEHTQNITLQTLKSEVRLSLEISDLGVIKYSYSLRILMLLQARSHTCIIQLRDHVVGVEVRTLNFRYTETLGREIFKKKL